MPSQGLADHNGLATSTTHPEHPNHDGRRQEKRVTDIQRARMLTAMAEVACEHGASNATVAHIVGRAGVSRRTFYELFTDREDCFLATFDEAIARASERVLPAYDSSDRWRERIRAALVAIVSFVEEEPSMGKLLIVETLAAGPASLERRSRILAHMIDAIQAGNAAFPASGSIRLTAEGVVGAVLSVLHGRLLEDRDDLLGDLVNPLMSMIVLPYLGPAAARRELRRPPAKLAVRRRVASANPLRDLQMRLTYRTVRVLTAVASHPGASNRMIADASEIGDQGQISKLLTRLQRLGLVDNAGANAGRGEPNAWTLTQRGWQVHGALAERPPVA